MRMLMKVSMPVENANKAIKDQSLPKLMNRTIEELKAEAAYFTEIDGRRTALFVFDLADSSRIPSIAEPFFQALNAAVELHPVMNAQDMREGLEAAAKKLG